LTNFVVEIPHPTPLKKWKWSCNMAESDNQ